MRLLAAGLKNRAKNSGLLLQGGGFFA